MVRSIIVSILLLFPVFLYSQDEPTDDELTYTDDLFGTGDQLKAGETAAEDETSRINADIQAVYGLQYNNMLSTANISQEQENFVYYLNSHYKRSNDYGYKDTIYENSSYFENSLEFTGTVAPDDSFTTIFNASADTDSRGMFDKNDYSREEKDKVRFSSKNTKKFSSQFEAYISIGGAYYKHRLEKRQADLENVRNSLTRYTGETGGELIWSSSNRIRYWTQYTEYSYTSEEIPYDRYVHGEIVDDFKISDLLGFKVGLNFAWNRDKGLFAWNVQNMPVPVMPIAGMTIYGNQYYTAYINYRYDLQPFRPEEYYYEQNYIYPTYDLPPSKVHFLEGRIDFIMKDMFSLQSIVSYRKSSNYYNYLPSENSQNLLTAHTVETDIYSYNFDLTLDIIPRTLRGSTGYELNYFYAPENITYQPTNEVVTVIEYTGSFLNVSWRNDFLGEVYINPDSERKLGESTIGYLDVQFKTIESFYTYLRIENLYNTKYYIRNGYPEAGTTVYFGLRVLL
ncbi:MAG: hypothetical protein ACOC2H_00365 [Spirochaetota bacterium]